MDVLNAINNQREFFKTGKTRDINFRLKNLKLLKQVIKDNENILLDALKKDLGKSYMEGYTSEIAMVYQEINYMIKNLKRLTKRKKVRTSIINFKSRGYIYNEPYGNVLIMAPWNYPINLSIIPLVGAIAAGNTAIIKPSEYSPYTSDIIDKIITENFNQEFIKVIQGDSTISSKVLDHKFDMIFFTGGSSIGKIVMNKASKYLTPVILELGGKSPCIVDETADIELSAKRIIWGKALNAGQTCVAPDYIFAEKNIKDKLIEELIKNIEKMYGKDSLKCSYFPNIINPKHFSRIVNLIDKSKVVYGGKVDSSLNKISLTIMDNVTFNDKIMQEEIFGPLIPVLTYNSLDEVINKINEHEKPLALYLFSNSENNQNKILENISFGGGCINDTIMHLSENNLPFGGVGNSGMGSYHGKMSFFAFCHKKCILKKSNIIDMPFRYPPYSDNIKNIKKIIK